MTTYHCDAAGETDEYQTVPQAWFIGEEGPG